MALEVLPTFLEDLPATWHQLEVAFGKSNWGDVIRHTHSLRRMAEQIGGELLAANLQHLEAQLMSGEMPRREVLLTTRPHLTALLDAMGRYAGRVSLV